jgi:hypothetical protein
VGLCGRNGERESMRPKGGSRAVQKRLDPARDDSDCNSRGPAGRDSTGRKYAGKESGHGVIGG